MTTLSIVGENKAISRLARTLGKPGPGIVGIGDDAAVVPAPSNAEVEQILTSDAVIEGRHYFPDTDPVRVGRKAINRVLSDIAAMGGNPRWILVNVVAPPSLEMDWLAKAYEGIAEAAKAFGATVVGGDLTPGEVVGFHVFGVGEVPTGKAVLRSGAQPTDIILVTGTLGGSLAGKHLDFQPRVREGEFLRNWATSMMDLSDGLAVDLRRLCKESATGALLNLREFPIDPAVHEVKTSLEPWEHVLYDGEDYELLFTVNASDIGDFLAAWNNTFPTLSCSPVGIMFEEEGQIKLLDEDNSIVLLTEKILQDYARQAFKAK